MIGKFWRLLEPTSESPVSFRVTPSAARSIPRAPLVVIEFPRMLFPVPDMTATPAWPLLPMAFAAAAAVPPTCVFVAETYV